MAEDATDANAASRDGEPLYRVAPGGREPHEWVVVTGTPGTLGKSGYVVVAGFATRAEAQAEADRLNAADQADSQRRDDVLRRMLGTERRHKTFLER